MKIKEIMKKPVVIERDMFLSDAAKLMTKHSISSLIIESDGEIRGMITHHDLIKYFGEARKVFEVMTKEVISLKDKDKIDNAIEIVKNNNIGIFPVVDSKNKIVGIIDSKDLLKLWGSDEFLID